MDYDSESGSEFNPSYPHTAEMTPSQHMIEGARMSDAAKRRVDRVTVNGVTVKRCLIESTAQSNCLDYAHCLRRSTEGPLASSSSFVRLTSNNNPFEI
jgi:hypothetical protein